MVKKPKTYDDEDPDYMTEDEDEDDYRPSNRKSKLCKRRLSAKDGVDETYIEKREKNNVAVRKSRMKLKHRQDEAVAKIRLMGKELVTMEQDAETLSTEIGELKDLLYRITSSPHSVEQHSPVTFDLSKLRFFDCMQ